MVPRKLPSCEETGTVFNKPTFEREGFVEVAEAEAEDDAVFKEAPFAAAIRVLHPPPNALAAITDHYFSLSLSLKTQEKIYTELSGSGK